ADPGDAADVAEVQVERSTRHTVTDDQRAQLAQVNRALAKLEEGSYGLSDVTGDPIPVARLEALPWATTNVEDLPGPGSEPSRAAGSLPVTLTSPVAQRPAPARQ